MNTIDYLLERYPEDFVHAVSTGAYSTVGDHADYFPILDVMGGRLSMAATIYAVCQSFDNLSAIKESFDQEMKLLKWNNAAKTLYGQRAKEDGRKQEERQGKRERQRDQPWRKRHA